MKLLQLNIVRQKYLLLLLPGIGTKNDLNDAIKVGANRFNVDERDILVDLGKMQAVGGQEDLIYEVAAQLEKA